MADYGTVVLPSANGTGTGGGAGGQGVTPISGSQLSTASAVVLPSQVVANFVKIENPPQSGQTVEVLASGSTVGILLSDGQVENFVVNNLNQISIKNGTGAVTVRYWVC